MKKIIFCLSILATVFASCSSDSDSPASNNPSNAVLLKKMVLTIAEEDLSFSAEYFYQGTKITRVVYTGGDEDIYTYHGDLITERKYISEGEVVTTETFTYDNNDRLISYLYVDEEDGYTEQETFVYNSDNTVTCTITHGGISFVETHYYSNDEIVKIEQDNGSVYNYNYDSKNSIFKNVTGYGKIAHVIQEDHDIFGNKQNISSIQLEGQDENYITNTFTYNSQNYPITVHSVAEFGFMPSELNVQFIYY